MEADLIRAENLNEGFTTVRQQVEYLLACVRKRELEKQLEKDLDNSLGETGQALHESLPESVRDCRSDPKETVFIDPMNSKTGIDSSLYLTNKRTLDIIEEEPSKLNHVSNHEDENILHERGNLHEEESDSSECSSSCSCCRDTNNFMSTSVSIVEEETIYSPKKKELSRAIRCTKIDQSAWAMCGADEEEETLKSLLQTRLQELETEIDAFKIENSHVSKLRRDFEKEYNKFCEEKIRLLDEIRGEHLRGVKELEQEKKSLQSEKKAFEKYMREVKNRPNKQEKEEIRLLKEEIKLLKEEMNKKECRWAAAQARIRTEMKTLKDRNSTLQEELKELKKTPKKVTFAPVLKKSKSLSNVNAKTKTNVSKSVQKNVNKSSSSHSNLYDSSLEALTSDSGIFTDTFQSSSESCDGTSISEDLRRSVCLNSYLNADKDNSSEEISASELSSKNTTDEEITEFTDSNGNREKLYIDGRREIWCTNGSVQRISPDEKITKTIFYNGDVEESRADENVVKYYHAGSRTWHSKFGDGLEIKEFPDGQVEKYFIDGTTEITLPDGTLFTITSSGEKKWNLNDGTVIMVDEKKHEKRSVFPNGQIETHTQEFKRREYPDGTVKTVYNGSGMQETRYPNGRIRLKSSDGTLISDTNLTQ